MDFPSKSLALVWFLLLGFILFALAPTNVILYARNQIAAMGSQSKFYMNHHKCGQHYDLSYRDENPTAVPESGCDCSNVSVITATCPPASPAVIAKKELMANEAATQGPWYAQGRPWHYPLKFPRCSMDVCFNYSRCENMGGDLLVYEYEVPGPPRFYFPLLNGTKWYTADPEQACVFLVYWETPDKWPPHPRDLPHWNGGMNHVLVSFAYSWRLARIAQESIGFASLLITDLHETTYRPGFDMGIPLPPNYRFTRFQHLKPWERKYLLTFRGLRYLRQGEGALRSYDTFREMHNGRDVIVATSCKHPNNDERREKEPALGIHCDEDQRIHDSFDYTELMNSTFGLAPAGVQAATYRFTEVLSAGAIPVVIADNYVKPLDTLIQWHKCILQFPSTEMRRIVPALRNMNKAEVEERQKYCVKVYNEYFKDDQAMLKGAIDSLKARFMGVFPNLTPLATF